MSENGIVHLLRTLVAGFFATGAVVMFGLGVFTLLPAFYAVSKPCLLGYEANCSFAPISSMILIGGGAVLLAIAIFVNRLGRH